MNRKPTTSEWVKVRKSGIHGNGVFAAKDIPKGTKIIEYVGNIVTKKEADKIVDRDLDAAKEDDSNGAVYVFELNKKQDIDGNVPWNTARLINHSCDPNCETEGDDKHIWIEAMRDIKKGEELSYDYCYDLDDFEEHPCGCGSDICVGFIVDEKKRAKLTRILEMRATVSSKP